MSVVSAKRWLNQLTFRKRESKQDREGDDSPYLVKVLIKESEMG